jgi:outer membrane biosynthesis protein TonB
MPKETTQVINVWNQPIYLNLPGGRSLKIGTRETAQIEESDLNSPAMIFHRSRGNILVLEQQARDVQPEAALKSAQPEPEPQPQPPPLPPPQSQPPPQVAAATQPPETAKPAEERSAREREHKTGKKGEQ